VRAGNCVASRGDWAPAPWGKTKAINANKDIHLEKRRKHMGGSPQTTG
jgi:hypothetical protein